MRPRRLVLLGLLAVAAAATVVWWPWIDAQRRAAIVLSVTSPTPVLSWIVRVATAEPRNEETALAGAPTTLVRPGDGHRWPAVVLIPGFADGGRWNPDVLRLAHGLARAGFVVAVPDLPGLDDGAVTESTVKAAIAVALETSNRDDATGGHVAVVGAWAGATVALLAAEEPTLSSRVSVVAAVSPWSAAPNMIRLATTGFALDGGELKAFQADPFLALATGRSLISALAPSTARSQLLELLRGVDNGDSDPLRVVRGLAVGDLPRDVAAVVQLLANRHPTVFEELYAALPDYLHARLERLSPLVGAAQFEAPVELVVSTPDRFVPPEEARALARASQHVTVTGTGAFRRGLPDPSFTESFSTDAFLVRVLRAAR